jgi:hypothetical protein
MLMEMEEKKPPQSSQRRRESVVKKSAGKEMEQAMRIMEGIGKGSEALEGGLTETMMLGLIQDDIFQQEVGFPPLLSPSSPSRCLPRCPLIASPR